MTVFAEGLGPLSLGHVLRCSRVRKPKRYNQFVQQKWKPGPGALHLEGVRGEERGSGLQEVVPGPLIGKVSPMTLAEELGWVGDPNLLTWHALPQELRVPTSPPDPDSDTGGG